MQVGRFKGAVDRVSTRFRSVGAGVCGGLVDVDVGMTLLWSDVRSLARLCRRMVVFPTVIVLRSRVAIGLVLRLAIEWIVG